MTLILITMGGAESFEETAAAIRATGARGAGGGSRQFVIDTPITAEQVAALWQLNTQDPDNPVTIEIKGYPEIDPGEDIFNWWHAENDQPRDTSLDPIIGNPRSRLTARG